MPARASARPDTDLSYLYVQVPWQTVITCRHCTENKQPPPANSGSSPASTKGSVICRAGTVLSATHATSPCQTEAPTHLHQPQENGSRESHQEQKKNILSSIDCVFFPTPPPIFLLKRTSANGLAHALAHNGPTSPTSSILMSTDRPNLLQRLDILPAAIRQRDDNMGRLHLLVEHLLECYSRTERYVVAVVVAAVVVVELRWRSCAFWGKVSSSPGKESYFPPRPTHSVPGMDGSVVMLISRTSRHNTRAAWAGALPSCKLVVLSSRLHESWVTPR